MNETITNPYPVAIQLLETADKQRKRPKHFNISKFNASAFHLLYYMNQPLDKDSNWYEAECLMLAEKVALHTEFVKRVARGDQITFMDVDVIFDDALGGKITLTLEDGTTLEAEESYE